MKSDQISYVIGFHMAEMFPYPLQCQVLLQLVWLTDIDVIKGAVENLALNGHVLVNGWYAHKTDACLINGWYHQWMVDVVQSCQIVISCGLLSISYWYHFYFSINLSLVILVAGIWWNVLPQNDNAAFGCFHLYFQSNYSKIICWVELVKC